MEDIINKTYLLLDEFDNSKIVKNIENLRSIVNDQNDQSYQLYSDNLYKLNLYLLDINKRMQAIIK